MFTLSVPAWLVIIFALGSAVAVKRYFGGTYKSLARLWVVLFYAVIWSEYRDYDTASLANMSRVGWLLVLSADIIPALYAWIRRRQNKSAVIDNDN